MNIFRVKKKIKDQYPDLWEQLQRVQWFAKLHIPIFYPKIFKDLSLLNSKAPLIKEIRDGQKILFFAVRQDFLHVAWEFVLAQALKLRAKQVDYIACDGLIRHSCNEGWYPELKKHVCKRCFTFSKKLYDSADFGVKWLSSFAEPEDFKDADSAINKLDFSEYKDFTFDGLALGELARPSVCHFCRIDEDIEFYGKTDPVVRKVYKKFLLGAVLMTNVCKKILSHNQPDVIVMINGLFMSERIMFELAKRKNKRVVVIETGLTPDTLVLLHNHYIHYGKLDGWEKFKSHTLSESEEKKLDKYIFSRQTGEGQTANYWNDLSDDEEKIRKTLCLESYKKTAVLFPNVTWDSALYGLHIMFNSLKEWISKSVSYFEQHSESCLIIRSHPADMTWPQSLRYSIYKWMIETYGGKLPENVKLIPPDSDINSYSLMKMSDFGLVYTSTTGLEMALLGKPVVAVGKVHYWNRGFTLDPKTEEEYFSMLDCLLNSGNDADIYKIDLEMARRYAYFIFFKSSFALKYVNSNGFRDIPTLQLTSYDELLPGNDTVLDMICRGITEEKPFYIES